MKKGLKNVEVEYVGSGWVIKLEFAGADRICISTSKGESPKALARTLAVVISHLI